MYANVCVCEFVGIEGKQSNLLNICLLYNLLSIHVVCICIFFGPFFKQQASDLSTRIHKDIPVYICFGNLINDLDAPLFSYRGQLMTSRGSSPLGFVAIAYPEQTCAFVFTRSTKGATTISSSNISSSWGAYIK